MFVVFIRIQKLISYLLITLHSNFKVTDFIFERKDSVLQESILLYDCLVGAS